MSDEHPIERVAVVSFERNAETGRELEAAIDSELRTATRFTYEEGIFQRLWDRDAIVAVMASGIVVRKIASLLEDKWSDPAVVAVDSDCTWAVPIVGGHHGGNRLAESLTAVGAVPAETTATEAAGKQAVEARAEALSARIETPDSTVATNLAVLQEELGPVERLDGPRAVLVSEDVTVLQRSTSPGIVLGTGCRTGTDAATCRRAWLDAMEALDRDVSDVEFVATGTLKADEPGLQEAAAKLDLGLVAFEKKTLAEFAGPSESKAPELVGWPGIAEASAIAGGRNHELIAPKTQFEEEVTVAVGR
ncbi:cobalt-precorrin 5A hydrolase [Halodesulfurarchaeum sp.]|uniref:cobalt-precorrin 5A hydrolase n=1 Tax=Halodesulfurarchaeum sp. TaxID=1980530 RepID=UPI002FC3C7AF